MSNFPEPEDRLADARFVREQLAAVTAERDSLRTRLVNVDACNAELVAALKDAEAGLLPRSEADLNALYTTVQAVLAKHSTL